jgi:excinuclease ABC subunit C
MQSEKNGERGTESVGQVGEVRIREVRAAGVEVVREFAKTLPNAPGVYRMMNAAGDVLYVGKARSLKKRVTTYTQPAKLPIRIQRMVHDTRAMEFVRTTS